MKRYELTDVVADLSLCREIPASLGVILSTALCWRTFNKGRKDEYTIVFPTGTLDPHDDDVPAPTVVELLDALHQVSELPTLWRKNSGYVCDCWRDGICITKTSSSNPASALLEVLIELEENS